MSMRAWLRRRRRIREIAARLADAESSGRSLIDVPHDMIPGLRQDIWRHSVEAAAEKWARNTAEVPLADWQASITDRTRRYRGQHRD